MIFKGSMHHFRGGDPYLDNTTILFDNHAIEIV